MSSKLFKDGDRRGQMVRANRKMADHEAREFLRRQKTAHAGTADARGWPYVVPLVYIYEGGDTLFLHTGAHQGHFLTNLESNPQLCVQVSEIGPVQKGEPFACDSALVYTSVITFGRVEIVRDDREKKTWFLDRLLEKYGDPSWTFEPGYPMIDHIIIYEQKIEIITGKQSQGLYH